MGLMALALLWGFAEATLFFIVPDVLLSAIAVWRGRRAALHATAWTIAGAILGGLLMYGWSVRDFLGVVAMLDRLPAISLAMIIGVRDALGRSGAGGMVVGALTGVPYKIYAVMAPQAGVALATFLAVSVPARALRFVLVVALSDAISRRLAGRLTLRQRVGLLASIWLLFYAVYWAAMPN
jgi:membrane protein YqaA with SNARE-associated domain